MERASAQQPHPKQRGAERLPTGTSQAISLALGRELVQASNTATDALEAEAAFSKLVAYDLPFFEEQAQLEREQYLAGLMTAAGRGLLDALSDLLNARQVWDRIADSERVLAKEPLDYRRRMELAELLTHHLPEVLLMLGYRPPPPAELWTDLVQNSLQNVLSFGSTGLPFAGNGAKAEQELRFFTRRLRTLVQVAEDIVAQDEQDGKAKSSVLRHFLRSTLSAARNRAIPAALAAGAGAAVAGIAGGAPGMGIAVLSGSTASLVTTVIEATATAWLADAGPHRDASVMSVPYVIEADLAALDECLELMGSATRTTIETFRFIIRRGVFQALQDAANCTVPVRDLLWRRSGLLLSLLEDEPFPADKAREIVDAAREAVRPLLRGTTPERTGQQASRIETALA